MAKRVFELAKDLDVTSKAILDKCRAEGIELKNHMAALSAGLVATIAEWFSEGSSATAVETSEHIDLSAAREEAKAERKRRRRVEGAEEAEKAGAALEEAAEGAPPEEIEPVAEPAEAPVETVAPVEPPVEVAAAVETPEPAAEPPVHKAPAHEHRPAAAAEVPAEAHAAVPPPAAAERPSARREAEKKEEPSRQVGPAGPQVVPRPAKLQGPRVVRFAGVDADTTARRPAPGYRGGAGNGGAAASTNVPPRGGARPPISTGRPAPVTEEDEEKKKGAAKKRSPRRRDDTRTVGTGAAGQEWRNVDLAERSVRLAAASGSTLRRHRANVGQGRHEAASLRPLAVEVEEPITVKSLSAAAGIKAADIIRKLMQQGTMVTINANLPRETVELLAVDMGFEVHIKAAKTAENELAAELSQRQADPEKMVSRAPVVAFLGHVDHGKTSLMDRIRNATVAAGEEGGITQGIGSYRYDMGDKHVVFLDTPGHEAFTAMRARGANMTDVVVLVVAADDGVMPQTIEAINHAKAAGVPIVVALNKIDLPNANANKALGQLAEYGLNPRQWGGTTEVIETSATTGLGVDTLIETLSLEAELLELKSDPTAPASGWVMESRMDPSRGVAARCLVRDGTLHVGDVVLCGQSLGRVRSILDHRARSIPEAGPASPVEISGLDEMPDAGDKFIVVDDLVQAREVAQSRRDKAREQTRNAAPTATLANMFEQIEAGKATEMRVIVKCDVQGSLEALRKSLAPLGSAEVRLNVLHSGVGGITEGDVLLAEASTAMILGFRVVADNRARALAEDKGVEVRTYRVIYQLIEELEKALHGLLEPELTEKVLGRATIRELFKVSRVGTIAGCIVSDGIVNRNAKYRIIRDNVVVEDERSLDSLRRFKDDVRDVRAGMECGIKVSGFDDLKVGDILEAYQSVEVARK